MIVAACQNLGRIAGVALAFACLASTNGVAATPRNGISLFAIGANKSFDPKLPPLQFAESDAAEFTLAMGSFGRAAPESSTFLRSPKLSEVRQTLAALVADAVASPAQKLVFYFSGHSDETGLHLADGLLSKSELHESLSKIPAATKIVILDSCFSGSISAKGIERAAGFELPTMEFDEPTGSVFLTASSGNQLAFESAVLKGSVFTHFLLAGLQGDADANSDGVVTVDEIYQYIYRHSKLRGIASPNSARQEPAMISALSGKGAIALTFPARAAGSIVLGRDISGEVKILSKSGLLFFHVDKVPGQEQAFKIPVGEFLVAAADTNRFGEAEIKIGDGTVARLARGDFRWQGAEPGRGGGPKGEARPQPVVSIEAPRRPNTWMIATGASTAYARRARTGPSVLVSFIDPWTEAGTGGGLLCDARRNSLQVPEPAASEVAAISGGCFAQVAVRVARRMAISFGAGETAHLVQKRTAWAPGAHVGADLYVSDTFGIGLAAEVIETAKTDAQPASIRSTAGLYLEATF